MLEVGRAQRTLFAARHLRDHELQREITEGLNVVAAFNEPTRSVIRFGRRDRLQIVRMSVTCLRILQAALVYVNTLLLQDVLTQDHWATLLTDHDRRGLTPLFWQRRRHAGRWRRP